MKKILATALMMAMVLTMSMMTGCKNEAGKETTQTEAVEGEVTTYSVDVATKGGMVMSGLDVYVYADDTLADMKDYGQTDEEGTVSFELAQNENYAIVVSGTPLGYQVEDSYSFSGTSASIELTSSVVQGEDLAGATLGLGDVMYDFTVTTPDGEKVTLSEMLKEKEMVLLNFWYTTCTYCVAEFPYMQEAYDQFSDSVGIIAVNPLDPEAEIAPFQQQYGLTFPMASCSPAWSTTFGVSGYPTSIIIDRYGVITLIEEGGITSLRPFVSLFETMTGDDYEQKLYTEISELVTRILPNFEMDTPENVAAIMNNGDIPATYYAEEEDEYSWPFIATDEKGETCLKASNQQIDGSYAILYADVELKAGQALGFDYLISSELGNDLFHVIVNDEPIYSISGVDEVETWKKCYPWVAEEDGIYEVGLVYWKDDSTCEGDDTVYIKNMRIVDASAIDVETYIPRYAAVSADDGFEYTYADIVLNPADGYYHVGSANGPLLLANLMQANLFSEDESVWTWVNNGEIVVDGKDYYDELVDYCSWASNSSMTGYCTVNEELAELLKIVVSVVGFEDNDNEWLKLCKYYDAYGTNAQLGDPIKGLAIHSAYTATVGKNIASNSFYYDRVIVPRGLIAEFIPTVSGAYRITSRTDEACNVEGWLFNADMEQIYVYEQCERLNDDPDNVSMVYYMEAGTPYYIDICFWDTYQTGTIYYDIEYLGSSVQIFRNCAPGYFTYDSDKTGDDMYYLITAGIDIVMGPDGYYHEDLGKDANGNQKYGSIVYADFVGTTGVFSTPVTTVPVYNDDGSVAKDSDGNPMQMTGMIDLDGFNFSLTENDAYIVSFLKKYDYDVDATDEYLREYWGEEYDAYAEIYMLEDVYEGKYHGEGPNLTEEIKGYVSKMITGRGAELEGCVPVDARLAEILQLLMDKYTFENVENSWLKMSYYYQYIGPEA